MKHLKPKRLRLYLGAFVAALASELLTHSFLAGAIAAFAVAFFFQLADSYLE
jgi:hypothetical protein